MGKFEEFLEAFLKDTGDQNIFINPNQKEFQTAQTSFKERVDKLFLMRSSGFKSSRLKLQINNSGLGDVRDRLENEVTVRINNVIPTQNHYP